MISVNIEIINGVKVDKVSLEGLDDKFHAPIYSLIAEMINSLNNDIDGYDDMNEFEAIQAIARDVVKKELDKKDYSIRDKLIEIAREAGIGIESVEYKLK